MRCGSALHTLVGEAAVFVGASSSGIEEPAYATILRFLGQLDQLGMFCSAVGGLLAATPLALLPSLWI